MNRRPQLGSREDWLEYLAFLLAIGALLWVTSVVEVMTWR
jgi:hypothetical protein